MDTDAPTAAPAADPALPAALAAVPGVAPILGAVDRLARMNDRWIAALLLCLILTFSGLVTKWLVDQLGEARRDGVSAQKELVGYYKEANLQTTLSAQQSALALSKLAEALDALRSTVVRIDDDNRRRAKD